MKDSRTETETGVDGSVLSERVSRFLEEHPPEATDRLTFLRSRFDAGLARVDYPEGLGGCRADRSLQEGVDTAFASAGAPTNRPLDNVIGLGMAAPTLLAFGTPDQQRRWVRPLWTGEELWCQLFSEPGAGSDLAGLACRAVRDGDDWIVDGHKVWTTLAHRARWALLVARTDPAVPKHRGLTYFVCDMTAPGIRVRPLRQITGETEFNEVFLTGVRIPDSHRIGEVGGGWTVAQGTLMNERVSYTSGQSSRDAGAIGSLLNLWRARPERRTAGMHDRVLQLWVEAESARLAVERLGQQQMTGQPGPEGSGIKLEHARLNQEISSVELELLGADGLRYPDYAERQPGALSLYGDSATGWGDVRVRRATIEWGAGEVGRGWGRGT
ncbi:acyl-CoA dehydrogenase family protein, partial [Rhodococcus koreensis]